MAVVTTNATPDTAIDVPPDAPLRDSLRVGLLGGSFDPVHRAHVQFALTALRELDLLEVQLIPAADPWQRPALAESPARRLHMLQLAVQDVEGLRVNPMEIERGGASHTLTTVEALPRTIRLDSGLGSVAQFLYLAPLAGHRPSCAAGRRAAAGFVASNPARTGGSSGTSATPVNHAALHAHACLCDPHPSGAGAAGKARLPANLARRSRRARPALHS